MDMSSPWSNISGGFKALGGVQEKTETSQFRESFFIQGGTSLQAAWVAEACDVQHHGHGKHMHMHRERRGRGQKGTRGNAPEGGRCFVFCG